MGTRIFLIGFFLVLCTFPMEAQILKKLKKKVEQTTEKVLLKKTEEKTEKAVEGAIDGTLDNSSAPKGNVERNTDSNSAKNINTGAKRSFYTRDLIVSTSEDGVPGSSFYFDADNLAMSGKVPNSQEELFIDSEGFQYAYNPANSRWEKTGIMRNDASSFMFPLISISTLQLPAKPMLEASERAKSKGLNLNTFQIVEWAFVYKPDHFRNEDFSETKVKNGTRFDYTDPDYSGSYVVFDQQDRLEKALIKTRTHEGMMTGTFKFSYVPVEVNIPHAVEVKMPFQDLFMEGGNVTDGKSETKNSDNENTDNPSLSNKEINSMMANQDMENQDTANLLEMYDFDWQYHMKMEFLNKKDPPLDVIWLLKENVNYQGFRMNQINAGGKGDATMVFDLDMNSLLMFINSDQNKILQIQPLQASNTSYTPEDVKVSELPAKTILGYNCNGLQIENDQKIIQVYHTDEAPIEMKNFFNFSGTSRVNLPNVDPNLIDHFSKGLVLEMRLQDKKKSKNDMLFTAQSIKKEKTIIKTKGYQVMNFFGQMQQRQK